MSSPSASQSPPPGAPKTVAEAIGQIVWLLTQSPLHREMKLKDLESTFMPAVVHEQFRIFRFGPLPGTENIDPSTLAPGMSKEAIEQLPLGVAIWGHLSEAAEGKLEAGERLTPEEWKSGDRTWLVELISPFATPQNKLSEVMLLDLINGPFHQTAFNLHRTDPQSRQREKICVDQHLTPASA